MKRFLILSLLAFMLFSCSDKKGNNEAIVVKPLSKNPENTGLIRSVLTRNYFSPERIVWQSDKSETVTNKK